MASESDGLSGRRDAQSFISARRTSEARNPIIGSRPVAGRPRVFFGLADTDICNFGLA